MSSMIKLDQNFLNVFNELPQMNFDTVKTKNRKIIKFVFVLNKF